MGMIVDELNGLLKPSWGAEKWIAEGFDELMKTPDDTIIFVQKTKSDQIIHDQIDCMGCLSHCRFSNWKDHDDYTTGKKADPRSFCIQKGLQNIAHGESIEDNLMFAGHAAYEFGRDPFYSNGFVPTVKQLVEENHLRWDSLGEFLALAVSIEDVGIKKNNAKAKSNTNKKSKNFCSGYNNT